MRLGAGDNGMDDRGFTILEILIALAMLSVALIALAGLATQSMKATESGKRLTQALNLASEKMEALQAIPYANVQTTNGADLTADGNIARTCVLTTPTPPLYTCTPTAGTFSPSPADNMQFTWWWTVRYVDLDNDGVYYSTNPAIDQNDMKKIDVTVTWADIFGAHTTTLQSLRSRVVGTIGGGPPLIIGTEG
ncbi:MAG: prepilin-type N-terminal cleavage/methylation domain-containing protein [Deltaproteobacteria bacterium]|nr:prepilin-type N-terminal cleavage/methylation domain-containing protein [Deltaproteobacteria bacterium]